MKLVDEREKFWNSAIKDQLDNSNQLSDLVDWLRENNVDNDISRVDHSSAHTVKLERIAVEHLPWGYVNLVLWIDSDSEGLVESARVLTGAVCRIENV